MKIKFETTIKVTKYEMKNYIQKSGGNLIICHWFAFYKGQGYAIVTGNKNNRTSVIRRIYNKSLIK